MTARNLALALAFIVLAALPFWMPGIYYVNVGSQILFYAIFALGLNVLVGYAGLVSLGHAGLFGISAYATGYMLQLASGVQLLAGVLLVVGRFVPLALALLAPMVVNIFLFHVFLEPSGLVMALLVVAAEIGLAWAYRDKFRPMLKA